MSDENKPVSPWKAATDKAAGPTPPIEGEAKKPRGYPMYDAGYTPAVKTHEQIVQSRLGWIVAFTGIVAAATVANFIAALVIGASAAVSTPSF